jgi:short subunit dehydrogenase-like uncharacterized protein
MPKIPGLSHPVEERRLFEESVKAALAHRQRSDLRRIRQDLAEDFATREELANLKERVANLGAILQSAGSTPKP